MSRKTIRMALVVEDGPASVLVISRAMAALRAQGVDVREARGLGDIEAKLAKVVEERNLAVAETHELRCRLEALTRPQRSEDVIDQCPSREGVPAEDCGACTGEACFLCGAGCWDMQVRDCEHDVIDRHREGE